MIKNSKQSPLVEKIIRIPLWKSFETLFFLPFLFVLFVLGLFAIIDGLYNTNFFKPHMGKIGIIIGIVLIIPLFFCIHRIFKYPKIIFTKDYVIIPPVKFYHFLNKIIYYNKIRKIEYGGLKYGYRVLYDKNKCINFSKDISTHKLWHEFDHELFKRYKKALKEKDKYNKHNNII